MARVRDCPSPPTPLPNGERGEKTNMPQILRCPHCQKTMQVPDNVAGKRVSCPSCKQPFMVPAAPLPPPSGGAASTGAFTAPPPRPAPAPEPTNGSRAGAATTPTKCPSCGSQLLEGAVSCMDCGFLLQTEAGPAEPEGPPNLCANPACGVANPPGERNCQRCGNPLPIAGGTLLGGRYRLDKLLKMGGFGAVNTGTDTKKGDRPVADKDMRGTDPQER